MFGYRTIPLLLGALALLSGCAAQRVVFRPNGEQRERLREPPLPYVVRVGHWTPEQAQGRNPHAYSANVARILRAGGALREVHYDTSSVVGRRPDLLALPTADHCNSAVIPILSILTLGVVPTIWTDHECTGVVFRHPDGTPADSVVVRIRHRGTAVLGWLAAPLALLPSWSLRGARDQKEYHQSFRLAIIARKDELARLALR